MRAATFEFRWKQATMQNRTTRQDSGRQGKAPRLDEALRLHQAGKLDQAAHHYLEILKSRPDDFDALHLLGVVRLQQGQHAEGCERIQSALKLKPGHAVALCNLGTAFRDLKRPEEALASYDRALAARPDYPEALNNRGIALKDLNRPAEALASFDRAVAIRPDYAEALNNRGNVLKDLGRPRDALASFDKALTIRPRYPEALNNRGSVLIALKRHEEALASYDRALAIRPAYADALNNRGNALKDLQRLEEALASYDKALAIRPDYPEALNNRGNALTDLFRPAEALASYEQALAIRPDFADALNNRGTALMTLRRLDEARASFGKALAISPDFADARYNRGLTALLMGNYAAGWTDYECRWDQTAAGARTLIAPYPVWRGEDLKEKSIIIYEEQGLGDVIQFCRFLSRISSMGAAVTFLVRPSLHRLLRPLTPAIRLIDAASQGEHFDFQSALMSLPLVLGTTLESIPADVPYLFPEEALAARWRQRVDGPGLKIGICWQGTPGKKVDVGRSFPLRCMEAIAAVPGVRLVSLQKTHGLEQLAELPSEMRIETLGDEFDHGPDAFIDTAAIMSNLDLVVTSDTSIAHLAGAMALRTWVALRYVPDWRWMLDRRDSPWYPTMSLFRQEADGDWESVFSRMRHDLLVTLDHAEVTTPKPGEDDLFLPSPTIQVSWGELIDKITILEIKEQRLTSPEAVANVRRELALLRSAAGDIDISSNLSRLKEELRSLNQDLWQIEDDIRAKEAQGRFDEGFVELARLVYTRNDRRALVKHLINQATGSTIVEEKQYTKRAEKPS